jgi:2-oxoglutarate dehydrogenase E2 component (dihydrolipoamide succinyltransferase)
MNLSVRLNNLAAVSTGTARAVFESANAAYSAIFEGEEDELAELSELGNELGDDLGANEETEDPNATQEPAEQPEQPAPEQPAPEQSGPAPEPQNVNAQSQPASISADALIKELKDLKYDEKIRIVAQKMKRAAKGKAPDAEDMAKPVAEAIAKYMTKKGYAAMDKEDFEKVVKTTIMSATKQAEKVQTQSTENQPAPEQPAEAAPAPEAPAEEPPAEEAPAEEPPAEGGDETGDELGL